MHVVLLSAQIQLPKIKDIRARTQQDMLSLFGGHPVFELLKYLNGFITVSARGLFDYDLIDRIRNNGTKLMVKHFDT